METIGFCRRITDARERRHMPRAELGHRIGLSPGTVELVERGLRPFPKNLFGVWMTAIGMDTDIALAEYLGMIAQEVCRMSGLPDPIFTVHPVTKRSTDVSNHASTKPVLSNLRPRLGQAPDDQRLG